NPNNPTGTIFSHAQLSKFLNDLPRHIVVVLDEAYAEYVTDSAYPDSLQLQKEFENLVILRTFSKIYGLAGLRIGYGIAHPDIIRSLRNSYTQFSVNRLASAAALAALDDAEFVEECADINERERTILCKELKRMGFDVTPSQGNFLMVEFAETGEMEKIFETLKDAGIAVRPLGPFGVEKGLRISVGRPEENKKLIGCLKEVGS
ncbi:MAG: aminotransferase class I/II-fold pyridoxal phosphate-dependent enzyme, partial [Candidatus Latescibacterota bacterium]